ncbi:MAG: phage tail sheath C-terminal domain-containing protein [Pyrinomonadaceae bacterium]
MPVTTSYPGVYIEEVPSGVRTITGVPTSITAFVGSAPRGPVNDPRFINSYADYERQFGGLTLASPMSYSVFQYYQNGGSQAIIVRLVGANAAPATITLTNGVVLRAKSPGTWGENLRVRVDHNNVDATHYNLTIRDMNTGEQERFINLSEDNASPQSLERTLLRSDLVEQDNAGTGRPDPHAALASPGTDPFSRPAAENTYTQANADGGEGDALVEAQYIGGTHETDKTGLYNLLKTDIFNILVMPPPDLDSDIDIDILSAALTLCAQQRAMLIVDPLVGWTEVSEVITGLNGFQLSGESARNAALYFPRLSINDPDQSGQMIAVPPSGAVAGVYARTDVQRGVWKAPAGTDASLSGVPQLSVPLTDLENGQLNPLGVNCLRAFPIIGRVVWGARTLRGADILADEWKYVPVRRLALFIEESLYRGTKWAVFEPNDEPLWAQLRLNVGAFMQNLFRQGAFQGSSPREAYFVKCDKDTTTQNHINLGIVNVYVGFAPLKPAEFVIIKIQQMAGQVEV